MTSYRIEVSKTAEKTLRKLRGKTLENVVKAIRALADDPRPNGCRKLSGYEATYRIRVGRHRVIYDVHDDRILVIVVKVGHRRDVYR